MTNWIKAGAVGALGSLVIFVVMFIGINVTGMAPFNMPPSAAFLKAVFGLELKPLALAAHFGYGIAWAIILLAIFGEKTDIWRGIGVSVIVQWLVLMQLVYSPLIGWGIFGRNAGTMEAQADLALNAMIPYIVMTLVLHIVYGALNGWLIPLWTGIRGKG